MLLWQVYDSVCVFMVTVSQYAYFCTTVSMYYVTQVCLHGNNCIYQRKVSDKRVSPLYQLFVSGNLSGIQQLVDRRVLIGQKYIVRST